jgi:hypothetical protein
MPAAGTIPSMFVKPSRHCFAPAVSSPKKGFQNAKAMDA